MWHSLVQEELIMEEVSTMAKVVITQSVPPALLDQWRGVLGAEHQIEVSDSLDRAAFAHSASDAAALINLWHRVDAALLRLAPQVRFIQQLSVGYDHLDLAALAQAGVLLANTPGGNTSAVAEHTILLMLSLLKRFPQAEQAARANAWSTGAMQRASIGDLSTATVGLIGFGTIGRAVAERLRPFGPRLLYTARRQADADTEARLGAQYTSLPELLASASIISLHLPLSEQTRHLLGAPEFAQMRPGALLVNTARGSLIDEQALRQALTQGTLAGAALDVLEREEDGGNPFTDLPQVIVTPHIAGISQASVAQITRMGITNIARFLRGEPPEHLVALPVTLEPDFDFPPDAS
jgi:phosphoglycerate dehydrogenase-like enzyme